MTMWRPAYSILDRQAEWMAAIRMVVIAATIASSPQSVPLGGFFLVGNIGLTALVMCLFFAVGGMTRVVSLSVNGNWPIYGPRLRIMFALLAAVVWGQMAYSLAIWSHFSGYTSMGVGVYGTFVLDEGLSILRVRRDGRSR